MSDYTDLFRGDTFKLSAQVVDENGAAVPLPSGVKLLFSLKRNITDVDGNSIFEGSLLNGAFMITDPIGGFFDFTMPGSVTSAPILPDNEIVLLFSFKLVDLSGNSWTLDSGTMTFEPDVTRRTS